MTGEPYTCISHAEQLPAVFVQPFTYWNQRRGEQWAPQWREFRLDDLNPKLLPWSVVVDVLEGDDFYYRFWGSERARLIGLELSRRRVSQIPNLPMRDANLEEYRRIREIRRPLLFNTLIAKTSGRVVHLQSLRLPISDGRQPVAKIYSVLNYEQVNELQFEVLAALLREDLAAHRFVDGQNVLRTD